MRNLLIILFSFFSMSLMAGPSGSTVIFTVDMSGTQSRGSIVVGIRGSASPLSWNKTLVMKDSDGDGIFEAKVTFKSRPANGVVSYKFVIDNKNLSDDELDWEFDTYGSFGNRTMQLRPGTQYASPAVYNQFDDRQRWMISEGHAIYNLVDDIQEYKSQRKSPEQLGKDWGKKADWDWVTDLSSFHDGVRYNMHSAPLLRYEVVKMETNLIQVKTNKPYHELVKLWDDSDSNRVNPDEIERVITSMFQTIASKKGFKYSVEKTRDGRMITMKVQDK